MYAFSPLPDIDINFIETKDIFFLFETSKFEDDADYYSYVLFNPIDIIEVFDYKDIEKSFLKIENLSKKYFVAGFISYEAGYFLNDLHFSTKKSKYPLLHFAVFNDFFVFNHKKNKWNKTPPFLQKNSHDFNYKISNLRFNISYSKYKRKIKKIKKYIEKGETYQINYTGKYKFRFSGNQYKLYIDLKNKQNTLYSAFLKMKDKYIISLSPELFFSLNKNDLIVKPMKGTIRRGRNLKEDFLQINKLRKSEKERAENLMIVDLLRNDMGKISKIGSVKTENLFQIKKYETLFQMISTVKSILEDAFKYIDIFKSIFPSGSVTGAPKLSSMQIIRSLEKEERGVYCGAVGFFTPERKAVFNVPIRTIYIDRKKGEMGAGSGITYSSDSFDEYKECKLKADFLLKKNLSFKILETILYEDSYFLLDEHIKRMSESAEYFDFIFDRNVLIEKLEELKKYLSNGNKYKIRILLDKNGKFCISKEELNINEVSNKIIISNKRTNSDDVFLFHKTTNRNLYDSEYRKYRQLGYFDVIFFNEKGELTEGSISNIFIRKNDRWYTPKVESGLLDGVYRKFFIRNNKVEETALYKKDLFSAEKIILTNSVRKEKEVFL